MCYWKDDHTKISNRKFGLKTKTVDCEEWLLDNVSWSVVTNDHLNMLKYKMLKIQEKSLINSFIKCVELQLVCKHSVKFQWFEMRNCKRYCSHKTGSVVWNLS